MNQLITWIEELSMNARPSLTTRLFDGWILRFSDGYTYRANSVNPIYQSTYEIEYKIDYCEKKYISENLPVIYKLTQNCNSELDKMLESKNYRYKNQCTVMTMPLNSVFIPIQPSVMISKKLDDRWIEGYFKLANIKQLDKKIVARKTISNIQNEIICAYVEKDGIIVACGLGVVERGFVGLFDINVHKFYRRMGFGTQICKSILREGIKSGAYMSYLQLGILNYPAAFLYRKLGFKQQYKYWYRVKS